MKCFRELGSVVYGLHQRWLTAMLLMLTMAASARNYVVLIGIADYPGTRNDLKVSSHDAVTMKTLYEKNGDAVIELLTDSRATVANVKSAIATMFARAAEDDAVVLFFSGHGVPGGFVCYDGLLRYADVTKVMMQSEARQKIVLADACFAGKARTGSERSATDSDVSVMFFLSSRTNEKSQERRGWRNSLFTAYLERGLRGGADCNRDRTVTARELFDFVSLGVAKDSRQQQHPVMWGKFNHDMAVMTWKEQ